MPTFYLANLNPGAGTLTAAGTFSGRVTVQPTTNSTAQSGTNITDATIQPYFKFYTASNEQSVTFTKADNLITWATHGLTENQEIVFSEVSESNGITAGASYYVIASGLVAGYFKVSDSVGGTEIDLTSDGATSTGTVRDVLVTGVSGLATGTDYVATVTSPDDTFTLASHGLANGATIVFSALGGAVGPSIDTIYYVINKATNTFEISTSSGGTKVEITTGGTCIGGTTDATFAFAGNDAGQTEFISLLSTEVFGNSEASDLFSNQSVIKSSHETACTSATTSLDALVRTAGANASSELVNAMFVPKEITQRFTLPYNSTQLANTIVTGTDLALTGTSGANAYVDLTAKGVTFTASVSPNVTITSHGLTVGDIIQFAEIITTTNFLEATNYVVKTVESGTDTVTLYLATDTTQTAIVVNLDGTGNIITKLRLSTNPVSFTAATDLVTIASGHPFTDNSQVIFTSINTTTGIVVDTAYYIVAKTATTFQLAESNTADYVATEESSDGEITFTLASHGFINEDPITFKSLGDTIGTGLAINTTYYVREKTANTFKLETSVGNGALPITTAGTCVGTTPALPLANDGNGILTRYGSGYAKGETATITGVNSADAAATITIELNSVQAAMLNGTLNNVGTPTEVPIEADDKIRVKYTIASKSDQENTSGVTVTATQTFFTDFTVTAA